MCLPAGAAGPVTGVGPPVDAIGADEGGALVGSFPSLTNFAICFFVSGLPLGTADLESGLLAPGPVIEPCAEVGFDAEQDASAVARATVPTTSLVVLNFGRCELATDTSNPFCERTSD